MQTPDHQSENQLDTMKTMKSDLERTVSAQSPSANGLIRLKECKVSEGEEELPEENVFKEDLVERYTILEQYYEEDGMQTPDHQSENQLDTMKTMKSQHQRIVCSTVRPPENKQSVTDIEEEPPVADILEEKLKLREQNKILEQRCQELLRSNTLKDEELKTERKQNEEKSAIIESLKKQINLQTKSDEELLRSNTLKGEELKTERKQNEEKSAIIEILGKQIRYLQTKYDNECEKSKKEVRELEREKARLEEEAREEYEEGNEMVKTQMEITEEVEREKARLEEECKELKMCRICLEGEKKIILIPCGHFGLCQNCYGNNNSLRNCPYCRKEISDYVKVFHP